MDNYNYEKKKLLTHINKKDVINLLKQAGCFIAGGAITSVFSGKPINDIDVYFKDYESLKAVISTLFNESDIGTSAELFNVDTLSSFSLIYTNHTKKSILFTKDGLNVQLIYFKFFKTAEEIFKTFDFTINMGAYDCATENFVLHPNFIKDIAQRRLCVNTDTSFPIISLLRVDKYKQKGYQISRKDFINLCLATNKLELKTWEQTSEAIGGMYGYTYTDLFDITKEFSIDEVINQLSNMESNLEDHIIGSNVCDYDTLIESIEKTLNIPKKLEDRILYKKVLKTDVAGVYTSYYYKNFKYTLNGVANGGPMGIWAYKTLNEAKTHFVSNNKDNEIIIVLEGMENSKIRRDGKTCVKVTGDVKVIEEIQITQ